MRRLLDCLERCPWAVVAVYLASLALTLAVSSVLFGNARFAPELRDEAIVLIDGVHDRLFRVALGMGVLTLLAPIVPLCAFRFGLAGRMSLFGLCGLGASVVLIVPIVVFGFGNGGQSLAVRGEAERWNEVLDNRVSFGDVMQRCKERIRWQMAK